MKSKRILLIGGNYYPEPTGIGKYNGEMMDWFATNNFECSVITTYPYYPQWKVEKAYSKARFWYKKETRFVEESNSIITIFRCPHYVPKSPSGSRRIISDFSFLFSACLIFLPLLFSKRFDYIITVAPSFSLGLLGILYKMFRRTKLLYHIQDLQIEAARDLKMLKFPFVINVLLSMEKFILNRADCISTISPGMLKKVKAKCSREIVLFPNWVDIELFHPVAKKDDLKKAFGFNPDDRIILYSGAIGHKQGLEAIIYSAKFYKNSPHIKFIICGLGPYKSQLEQLTNELKVNNVVFMSLQPFKKFNSFLNIADVHLVLQKANASDLMMPSKLSAIFSIGGVAIVTAVKGTSLYDIVSAPDMCIVVEPENQEALNEAIAQAINKEHIGIKINTRRYAEENLTMEKILRKYSELIQSEDFKTKEYSNFKLMNNSSV